MVTKRIIIRAGRVLTLMCQSMMWTVDWRGQMGGKSGQEAWDLLKEKIHAAVDKLVPPPAVEKPKSPCMALTEYSESNQEEKTPMGQSKKR